MFKYDFYEFLDQNIFSDTDNQTLSISLISGLYAISDGHMEHNTEVVYDYAYTPIKTVFARKFVITHDQLLKIINNGRDELKHLKYDFEYFYLYRVKCITNYQGRLMYEIYAAIE